MSEKEYLKRMGEKIRLARKKANLSQECLAPLVPIMPAQISYIENGMRGSRITTLKRIAEVLKCDVKDFL